MLPIKELSTNSDRTDSSKENSPQSHTGLAEFILLAFITQSIGLSIPIWLGFHAGGTLVAVPKRVNARSQSLVLKGICGTSL